MGDPLERFRRALEDRYRIDREVGAGGMATVYLAEDLKHHRPVALKVLRPEIAQALGPERFLREITLTAGLDHPHILPLLDSGEADGFLYYSMPYVAGESLRQRLNREKQLPLDDALQITREVADALGYAHSRGIVHRDIKPENILLTGGHARVADFGIATALTAAGGERLTDTGIAVGTPAYMSPEQGAGSREVDGRSDLYSLGCVLYEMLAGHPPFTGATAQEVLARHSMDVVPRLGAARPTVPEQVDRAIGTALAKVPADRFATAAQLLGELTLPAHPSRVPARTVLRGVSFATVTVALAVLVALMVQKSHGPHETLPSSVAVLPCTNATGDSTAEYVTDGLTAHLIDEMARSGSFEKVISLASSIRYKESTTAPQQLGKELAVRVLVFCRHGRRGSQDALSFQAVNARDGAVLWSAETVGDGIALTGPSIGMAESIARHLRLPGGQRGRTTVAPREPALRALNLYKEAQHFLRKYTPETMRRSIVLFREAIDADSMFAEPYVGLGTAYFMLALGHSDVDPREALPLVHEAARRALELNPLLADAHTLLAQYQMEFGWDWEAAERELRQALAINPNSAPAYDALGFTLLALGRPDDAFAASDRAVERDPVDPIIRADAGVIRYLAGRYREAAEYIERALAVEPEWPPGLWALGAVHAERGELDLALQYLEQAYKLSGRLSFYAGYLGYAQGLAGDTTKANVVLREVSYQSLTGSGGKAALAQALVNTGLGRRDHAIARFSAACDQRSSNLYFILTGPPGKRLASDPRYRALLDCLRRRT